MSTPPTAQKSFEDYSDIIDENLRKRKGKWSLTSLAWMDYDDVSQIIRIHIFNKWEQYDQTLPFEPWLNKVISHQIKNLVRNNYTNYAKPCLRCAASLPDEGCDIYITQCDKCPLFKNWKKRKQNAYNIKLPISMEYHAHEMSEMPNETIDMEENVKRLHTELIKVLKPSERIVYESIYINNETEEDVAKKLGYITSETGRCPGYKQIRNIEKAILDKARKCLKNDSFDIV